TFPRENLTVLTVSFYDNYQFLSLFSGSGDYSFAKAFPGEMNDAFPRVVGQTTGTMVRILETDEFLKSVSYYNNRHQMIQSISDNHLGGKDRVSQDFDFTRRLKARVVVHATANSEHRILEEFEYDHSGRILAQYHTIDDNGRVQLLSNGYNELGQLVERNLHLSDQGFVQSVDLRYNIRGWLTHINNASLTNDGGLTNDEANDLFGMEFKYNNPAGEASPQYTGNISEVQWRNLGTSRQRYEYQYDMAHRLVRADYLDLDNPTRAGRYSEMITGFDRNGNIQKLERKGLIDEPGPLVIAPFGPMDELQYAYEGNRLLSVTDLETGTTPKEKGFKDGNKSGSDYSYDANGNFTSDKNKDIVSITYNHLNLPVTVEKSTGETITYVYTATGTKLAQSLSSPAKVTQYDGAFIYENGQLQFVQHGEGRILMRDEPEYQYHIKDQVGNVRLTFTSEKIREVPKATMEPDNIAEATANFLYYDEAVKLNSDLFDHTKNGSTHYATRLSGAINETTGLARSVSVMPGDTIRAEVFVKYVDPNTDNWTGDLPALMASLADNSAPPGTLVDHGLPGSTGGMSVPFALLLSKPEQSTAAPKAFLNFLVFDSDFNLIEEQSGFIQVSEDAKENGENRSHERLFKEIIVEKSGYVYIFLSNDNLELQGATADVFFDDFSVEHMNSPIVQADDYYPFGLTFNNYQRENAVTNNFLYNGKERQNDLDLGWFDFGARMYMPEIARFGVLDPLGDMTYTQGPYNYVLNNPIYYADYKGKIPVPVLYFVYEGLVYAFTATAAMYIVVNHEKLTDGIYFGSTDSYLEARSKTKIPYYAPYVWKNWKPRAVIVDEHPNMEPKPDPNSKDNKPGSSFQKGAIAFLLLELLRECQTAGGQDMVEVVKEIDDANERINTRINEIYDLLEDIDPEKDRDEYLKLLDEKEALQNVRTEHNQLKSLIEMAEELAKSLEEDKKVKQDATRRSDQNYSKEFLEWWYKDTNKDKDDEDEDDD
ncbi:MAG TPA: RHS repeat-associated core domain-containing protein, partial [Chryseosolibacter sp.]|nr:RHS repeat-associated core domain-containing protein [Chryseosolibacter sp.]